MYKLGKVTVPTCVALVAFGESPAHAYMGAGAGLSAIGSMISFLGVLFLMVFGFIWFPLKRAFKKATGKNEDSAATESAKEDASEPEEAA
ncbi:hypothetical protein [Aurantiacibacter sp. D1-12]|uniref:hypothetical protein n=1 Tax=Aurantiacibacter sp. D1-12 TaxID=2993658 RepID=UPI00237CB05A|nr:hypothetical protein [Aurantiacibacter sp. D1-12]MDE1467573.1 hypothetical protein [Aurantiacibacter sp. D1-12]